MSLKLNKETIKSLNTNNLEQVNGGIIVMSAMGQCHDPKDILAILILFSYGGATACIVA